MLTLGRLLLVTLMSAVVAAGCLLVYSAFGLPQRVIVWLCALLSMTVWVTLVVAVARRHADGALAPWEQKLLLKPAYAPRHRVQKIPAALPVATPRPALPVAAAVEVIDLRTPVSEKETAGV